MDQIFIPGNVPSSKNNKQWTGRFLIDSKITRQYKQATQWIYSTRAKTFHDMIKGLPKPYRVSFKFVRGSRHKFDAINAAQIVQDLMVNYEWINDDNMDEMIPVFEPYEYDPKNAGVYISVIK